MNLIDADVRISKTGSVAHSIKHVHKQPSDESPGEPTHASRFIMLPKLTSRAHQRQWQPEPEVTGWTSESRVMVERRKDSKKLEMRSERERERPPK